MKKVIYSLLTGAILLTISCSKFTDIEPKGKNLLTTTDQLEMLLNKTFMMWDDDMRWMSGDVIRTFQNIPTLLSNPNKTLPAIIYSWDEANIDKMAELTAYDWTYETCYVNIGQISNAILLRVDHATGHESLKNQLKSEALVLRAYYHYILVNKFAKAFNPSTAASDPAIPYLKEDFDISTPTKKSTVKEVYDNIITDLDKAIQLNALPVVAINRMRMSKSCAYAVKALALISMQKFDEASDAAKQSLAINNIVNNYNQMLTTYKGNILGNTYDVILRPLLKCEEDLFTTYGLELMNAITTEAWNAFEPGHVSRDKMTSDRMMYDFTNGWGNILLGLNYTVTYDMSSGWNGGGIKTTHMYLIVAEAEIRKNNFPAAMEALDAIRINRIDPSIYTPLKGVVNNKTEAILRLKQTSHGENLYSCHNFINKKRWNQLDDYKQTLTKTIGGKTYELKPESKLWIFPIPANAVNTNPNLLPQNYSL
ncbi:MAG: RagB/SusD family nutrient uptake outer membrane protein [Bacteroidales bacterium]